ncbi:GTP 3',8-cyclase MoaA [Porticoccus hydrocarbonoclasticus]|uniref:GTP 3',8-cyclase MoaA n=1 Tax=Porticoccus hydrocarbonoclasticus TaxID=1073414 RepID=UPI002357231F|nr:GTP 3',8-cyclase MoaA [Porticoccus hydrocarbonoclasticus]
MPPMPDSKSTVLTDRFGRVVNYLRLSVTDRCDFRCVYCMAEDMVFVPRQQLLTLEELAFVGQAFVELGVSCIRLTGGEPLVRRNLMSLVHSLGKLAGLDELLLTTNGARLESVAGELVNAGIKRINISLDSLQPLRFATITRTGELHRVLSGIAAAKRAGIERVKINAVIMRGQNDDEIIALLDFALEHGLDISFIEEMPLGVTSRSDRQRELVSSQEIRARISSFYPLMASAETSPGPSRYYRIPGSSSRIGFISANTHNFCESCNRVRVTCEGQLLLCLGNEHSVDLRAVIRAHPGDMDVLKTAIVAAIAIKPERHHFYDPDRPQVVRFMNATGG